MNNKTIKNLEEKIIDVIKKKCSETPSAEEVAKVLSQSRLELLPFIEKCSYAAELHTYITYLCESGDITKKEFKKLMNYPFDYEEISDLMGYNEEFGDAKREVYEECIDDALARIKESDINSDNI